jgi:hypothetical protein
VYGFSRKICNRASLPSPNVRKDEDDDDADDSEKQKPFLGSLMQNYEPIREQN